MSLTVIGLTYAVGRQPVALVRLSQGPASDKVVGILPAGFRLLDATAELYRPHLITNKDLEQRGTQLLETFTKNIRRAETVMVPTAVRVSRMAPTAPTVFLLTTSGTQT